MAQFLLSTCRPGPRVLHRCTLAVNLRVNCVSVCVQEYDALFALRKSEGMNALDWTIEYNILFHLFLAGIR